MKLEDFISDSISQIVSGLNKAQNKIAPEASINPEGMSLMHEQLEGRRYDHKTSSLEEFIEFDIAVTQESGTGTTGGVGVFLGAVSLGSKGESENKEISVSRIKFRIPIVFPRGPRQH
jgi:hypothetical protein